MIRQWLGMTSDDLPDLRFYRDEFDDGMDYDQSAALLVADVATEFGQNVVELCPEAAKLI